MAAIHPRVRLSFAGLLAVAALAGADGAPEPDDGPAVVVEETAPPRREGFRTVVSESGRFAIDLPGQRVDAVEDDGGLKVTKLYVPLPERRAVELAYLDLEAGTVRDPDAVALLKLFRDGYRKGGKFTDEKELRLGDAEVPGIEYRLKTADGLSIRERLYLDGARLYALYAVTESDPEFLDSPTTDRFFDSFRIAE